jgi:hypothetical protein
MKEKLKKRNNIIGFLLKEKSICANLVSKAY